MLLTPLATGSLFMNRLRSTPIETEVWARVIELVPVCLRVCVHMYVCHQEKPRQQKEVRFERHNVLVSDLPPHNCLAPPSTSVYALYI